MITIRAPLSPTSLQLGKQGENAARQIVFDVSGWVKLYGAGTVVLLHQRSGDTEPYPVATTIEDGTISWIVSSTDTVNSGKGQAELQYIAEDALAKSVTYRTYVATSLSNSTDVPDAYETWLDTLTAMAAKTQASANESATNAVESAASAAASAESAASAAASAESASASATAAATSETKAEEYAALASEGAEKSGYFYVEGDEDGHLYYVRTDNVTDFGLEDNGSGRLEAVYGS